MKENSPCASVTADCVHCDVADFNATWAPGMGWCSWSCTTPRTLPTSAAYSDTDQKSAASAAVTRLFEKDMGISVAPKLMHAILKRSRSRPVQFRRAREVREAGGSAAGAASGMAIGTQPQAGTAQEMRVQR